MSYQLLEAHFQKVNDLKHILMFMNWDEATMMPPGGSQVRSCAITTLSGLLHDMYTDPRLSDWIDSAEAQSGLLNWERINIYEIKRIWREHSCIPTEFHQAKTKASLECEQVWRVARDHNDWPTILPLLKKVIRFVQEESSLRAQSTGLSPYDALIDLYEPGMKSSKIEEIGNELKSFLPNLFNRVQEKQSHQVLFPIEGPFLIEKQRQLCLDMMKAIGFDFHHGRLDSSHHPFCGGVPEDARITTRYSESNFFDALMATLHETGHALYEQGLPKTWRHQPVGQSVSTALHESQALLMEMHVCRSKEFLNTLLPFLQQTLLGKLTKDPAWQIDNLYHHLTHVQKGFIRIYADEVTYPLHVLLRYELEKALIHGDLLVEDLPNAWNEKMQVLFGLNTQGNFKEGCLQDVHWMAGIFGYFPTYCLGAITAAQIFAATKRAMPDLLTAISLGDFTLLRKWLCDHIHSQGSLHTFNELLTKSTGEPLNTKYYFEHLTNRYLRT